MCQICTTPNDVGCGGVGGGGGERRSLNQTATPVSTELLHGAENT